MAGDEEKPIRIVDRRMFTPDGDLRPDYQPEEAAGTAAARPEAPAAPPPDRPAERPEPEPEPVPAPEEVSGPDEEPAAPREPGSDFASLVRSLATTAYSALGLLPDPSGIQRRDAVVARQMIDWLAMLELKTRGNISFEESDFLARLLYELRLAYVEMNRPPAQE
jgi:hypothetical protein